MEEIKDSLDLVMGKDDKLQSKVLTTQRKHSLSEVGIKTLRMEANILVEANETAFLFLTKEQKYSGFPHSQVNGYNHSIQTQVQRPHSDTQSNSYKTQGNKQGDQPSSNKK